MNPPIMSRRRFFALSASVGAGLALVACGGGSSGSNPSGTLQVVKRFPQDALVPGKVRLPISLADTTGLLSTDSKVELPQTLTARVINSESGDVVIDRVTATRHDSNLSVPYWPFSFTYDTEGIYMLKVDQAPESDVAFQLLNREDVPMPLIGDALPPFDTPTIDDARGVDPICTRTPDFCPFHSQTLTEALTAGKPVVYLIGTPAYCTTGTCAPGLDALIEVSETVGTAAVFVHADVYADKSANKTAPAVQAYKLSYEPVLYITDAKGTIVDRLDAVFDVNEIRDVLAANGIS
jgi:hypothetical protein